ENLENISSIIFLNTSGDILNLKQQEVMEEFIKEGKGFVGIHSATDTEYDWDWYGGLVGAYFKSHPIGTAKAKINTIISEHISTKHLEKEWEIRDEWYNFYNINPNINILLNLDETSYRGGEHGQNHPITWYHEYSGGRSFYTALGHLVGTYSDPNFKNLIKGGILYSSAQVSDY
ncbi:MAG: Crp/Fnr family transcriptional regulator, partial [Euryarchaeota archaeon]|nr:Crp/Fnr family transcriptional regulator [Euryarchaeota archaeon]